MTTENKNVPAGATNTNEDNEIPESIYGLDLISNLLDEADQILIAAAQDLLDNLSL